MKSTTTTRTSSARSATPSSTAISWFEMWELRDGGNPGSTGNSDAKVLADIFAKYAEAMRKELNGLGASIGKLDGWAGAQVHDTIKMLKVSPEQWAARTIRYLDVERTFPDAPTQRRRSIS